MYTVFPGWDASLRFDALEHENVQDSAGNTLTWDENAYRIEGGAIYRVTRDLRAKLVIQATDDGEGFGEYVIPAIQVAFAF